MVDLRAIRDALQNRVAREVATGHRQRLEAVQVWLQRVERIDIQFNSLLSTSPVELQKLCFCGLCSKNVCSSYKYGEKVFLLLEEVKNLKSEGNFEVVTELTPTSGVEERPTQPTVGQDIMLEKAWNRLMEDRVLIMGLHGLGGVGKTTLFKKINNKFAEITGRFDVVIWVVVSQSAQISKLQDDIAEKLNLCDDVWKNKKESDQASNIYRVLKGKTFVLMLDDIWEIPKVKDWGAVRRMSLMNNDIEEITCTSKCSELTTLFLQNNYKLKNLSGEFNWSMQKLVVLDLSRNYTFSAEISNLSSLRILKLQHSKVHGDVSLVTELQLLEHLQVLIITISSELGLKQLSDNQRLANCTKDLNIDGFQQKAI